MSQAADLHPITRACMGFHLWNFAGLGQRGDRVEAAVTAARIAASEGRGAVFAPLAMGGAGGLRAGGPPADRLARWLDGMESACRTALRHLDDIEAWAARAEAEMTRLSGRTPPALLGALTEWPLVSAPMAEVMTGASRAAVQRNLAWMEACGLIREVTGQGRYRMWRALI
jgi:HTH DNA binding domain